MIEKRDDIAPIDYKDKYWLLRDMACKDLQNLLDSNK